MAKTKATTRRYGGKSMRKGRGRSMKRSQTRSVARKGRGRGRRGRQTKRLKRKQRGGARPMAGFIGGLISSTVGMGNINLPGM